MNHFHPPETFDDNQSKASFSELVMEQYSAGKHQEEMLDSDLDEEDSVFGLAEPQPFDPQP